VTKKPELLPNIADFDEIFFSSPSTCDAYLELFRTLPKEVTLLAQGPVTSERLEHFLLDLECCSMAD